jgi:hypothetical protein
MMTMRRLDLGNPNPEIGLQVHGAARLLQPLHAGAMIQIFEFANSICPDLDCRYTGPPFCSRSTLVPCNGAVILHASANADEMGSKVIPILWTAGENDPLYVRVPRSPCCTGSRV